MIELYLKCLPGKLATLENIVFGRHPYATPEWPEVRADRLGEKYLS
jgi:hypothetical protein